MRPVIQLLLPLLVASIACSALGGTPFPAPSPTVALSPTPPRTSTPAPAPPGSIPPQCATVPLATLPAATTVALPTPAVAENAPLSTEEQLAVLDELVDVVEEVYVYPEALGGEWLDTTREARQRAEAGLDTEAFYGELENVVVSLGDEHSSFESPVEVAASEAELAGSVDYVGIGVLIQPLPEKGRLTVLSVFPDSPAAHGGLEAHDSILAVDGLPIVEDGRAHPERTRGPECSAVVLTVQTPGEAPRDVTFVRARVTTSLPIDARWVPTADGSRVAYLFLPTLFDQTIPGQVERALEGFGPLDGLILDNRMNGGGSSTVVEPLLGLFTSGIVGHFASREGERPLQAVAHSIHNSQTVPMVVLVGQETVSYGEILSGVLQDIGRARVVGQTTQGNVEILHGYGLQGGSRVWIAEEAFDPLNSDADWETQGIIPEINVHADWDSFTFETDPAIAAALGLLGH